MDSDRAGRRGIDDKGRFPWFAFIGCLLAAIALTSYWGMSETRGLDCVAVKSPRPSTNRALSKLLIRSEQGSPAAADRLIARMGSLSSEERGSILNAILDKALQEPSATGLTYVLHHFQRETLCLLMKRLASRRAEVLALMAELFIDRSRHEWFDVVSTDDRRRIYDLLKASSYAENGKKAGREAIEDAVIGLAAMSTDSLALPELRGLAAGERNLNRRMMINRIILALEEAHRQKDVSAATQDRDQVDEQ